MNALIRYGNPLTSLSSWLDDVLGERVFESSNRQLSPGTWPNVDITEEKDAFKIRADLPGLEKKDVTVTVQDGILRLEGEKKDEVKREEGKYYHFERSYGRFSRSFSLPEGTEAQRIEAKMNNGVLELTIPKTEQAKPRQIEVKID